MLNLKQSRNATVNNSNMYLHSDNAGDVTDRNTLDDEVFVSVPHDRQDVLLLSSLAIPAFASEVVAIVDEETLDVLARHYPVEPVLFL